MRPARFVRPLLLLFMTGAIPLASTVAMAQGVVTGHVTAQGSGAPLAGAHVLALGTNAAANTAQDGKYTMSGVRTGTIEVQVLRVGYEPLKKTVTVTAGGTTTADFELTVAVVKLQEVLTTATGQQRPLLRQRVGDRQS